MAFLNSRLKRTESNISVSANLNNTSIEYISKVWEKVNEVNLGSEVITFNYFASTSIPDPNYIPDWDEPIINITLEGASDENLISFNTNTGELKRQILDAEMYINKNRFWLGEDQRLLLIDFLKLNFEVAHQIEKNVDFNDILKTKLELDSLRKDIYNYRNMLFKD